MVSRAAFPDSSAEPQLETVREQSVKLIQSLQNQCKQ